MPSAVVLGGTRPSCKQKQTLSLSLVLTGARGGCPPEFRRRLVLQSWSHSDGPALPRVPAGFSPAFWRITDSQSLPSDHARDIRAGGFSHFSGLVLAMGEISDYVRSRFVAALYGSRHASPVDLDFAKHYSSSLSLAAREAERRAAEEAQLACGAAGEVHLEHLECSHYM